MKASIVRVVMVLVLAARAAGADEPPVPAATEGTVNLNTATAEQLQLLPGIGATKARSIVEYRQRRPFARVDDVVAVRGIGRATLRRLRPYLAVRGDTTLARPVAGTRPPARPGHSGARPGGGSAAPARP